MHILPVKKNLFVLCLLLNDWNYFWNKYCNLPFLAICRSQLPLLISGIKKQKLGCKWACEIKKWLIIILKGFIKQPVIKHSPTFLSFSFLIDCYISVFSFSLSMLANFEKFIRFHRQAFTVYKNGENLKILIEIFCQKPIVSNVILAFLDHLKPKIFFIGQSWWLT